MRTLSGQGGSPSRGMSVINYGYESEQMLNKYAIFYLGRSLPRTLPRQSNPEQSALS
jgi:hypothetical protein